MTRSTINSIETNGREITHACSTWRSRRRFTGPVVVSESSFQWRVGCFSSNAMMRVPQAVAAIPGISVIVATHGPREIRVTTCIAVAAETAHEVYFVTHSAPESIAPFLDGISERLDNQYRVPAVLDAITAAGRTGGEER